MSLRRHFLLFCLFPWELYPARLSSYLPSTLTCPERFWPNSLCSIAPQKLKIICAEQNYFTNYASLSLIEKALKKSSTIHDIFQLSFNQLFLFTFQFLSFLLYPSNNDNCTKSETQLRLFLPSSCICAYQLNDETKPHYITISKCPLFLSVLCVCSFGKASLTCYFVLKYDRTYNSSTNEIFLKSYIALNQKVQFGY